MTFWDKFSNFHKKLFSRLLEYQVNDDNKKTGISVLFNFFAILFERNCQIYHKKTKNYLSEIYGAKQ